MKKILFLFLLVSSVARGQTYTAIEYQVMAVNASGVGPIVIYSPQNDTRNDSVWNYAKAHGTIAGATINFAWKYGPAAPAMLATGPSAQIPTIDFIQGTSLKEQYITAYYLGASGATSGQVLTATGTLPNWQTPSDGGGSSSDSSTSELTGTLHYAAGVTNWWLENDSGTTAHLTLAAPDSATMEGTSVIITTTKHVLDTVDVTGGVDKNATRLIFDNGNDGAPGTSTELVVHKGEFYTRNSGVTVQ